MVIYFSGTGNSYAVGKAVAQKYKDEVVPLKKAKNDHSKHIIFVFPTYAFDMPPYVKSFIEEFIFDDNQEIMGISVSGGDNGNSEKSFRKIITSKGLEVTRFKNIIMTDNSFPVALGSKLAEKVVDLEAVANAFWSQDLSSQKVKGNRVGATIGKAMFAKPVKHLLKKKVDTEVCTGCGICESICPVDNIALSDKKAVVGNRCAECFGCVHWCPTQAIRIRKPVKKEQQYRHPTVRVDELNK